LNVNIHEESFNEKFFQHLDHSTRFEIFYGGAGSGKSVFMAQKKVIQHLQGDNRKTLVLRKVKNTLRHSVFAEIKNVCSQWGVNHLFTPYPSYLEIHRKGSNNQIVFAGLDDPEKVKSIQGVTDIWVEEATEFNQDDLMQLDLRLRTISEYPAQISLSFNPVSALHWIKPFFFDTKRDDTTIVHSTYHDNKFLTDEYVQVIENLKNQDPVYYKIYALGQWGVLGNLIYTNYVVEDFDPDQFEDRHTYQGIDWGFNSPSAAVQVGWKDEEIYICKAFYGAGLTNSEFLKEANDVLRKKLRVNCDSAEPDRIKEAQQFGWRAYGANKPAGSLKFGIDFIKRHKIHIHPNVPAFKSEIEGYIYRKDKDGNVLDEPVQFRDHLMDAFRYALEPIMLDHKFKWAN